MSMFSMENNDEFILSSFPSVERTPHFTMTRYWEETELVLTVQGFGSSEDVRVEIRNRKVLLVVRGGECCVKCCKLPRNVDAGRATAAVDNGVLTVKAPKKQELPCNRTRHHGCCWPFL